MKLYAMSFQAMSLKSDLRLHTVTHNFIQNMVTTCFYTEFTLYIA